MDDARRSTRRRPRVYECCKAWDDQPAERRARWAWQVIHQLSHSRIPVTLTRLGEMADVAEAPAKELMGRAVGVALDAVDG